MILFRHTKIGALWWPMQWSNVCVLSQMDVAKSNALNTNQICYQDRIGPVWAAAQTYCKQQPTKHTAKRFHKQPIRTDTHWLQSSSLDQLAVFLLNRWLKPISGLYADITTSRFQPVDAETAAAAAESGQLDKKLLHDGSKNNDQSNACSNTASSHLPMPTYGRNVGILWLSI